VLDRGRVVGRGTDEELLQTNAVYRDIHEHGLLEREFADRVEARAG
jgi:ABC-type multidrug transport system fused ATPase/permease subunit